jgi:hypothetical protein
VSLTLNGSIAEFFHDHVAKAIRNQHVDATTPTEAYLVGLLAEFTKAPPSDEPLALKLAHAVSSPDERVRQLKDVGDTSLYVSGFFSDSLQRKLVDVDYYIQMGGAAYFTLARILRGNVFSEVYGELSTKFDRFVDVFAEVAEETMSGNVLALYERWQRTGAEWMARKLRAQGVLPKKGDLQ